MKRLKPAIYRLATVGVALAALFTTVALGATTASAQCATGADPTTGVTIYGACPTTSGAELPSPNTQWAPVPCTYSPGTAYYMNAACNPAAPSGINSAAAQTYQQTYQPAVPYQGYTPPLYSPPAIPYPTYPNVQTVPPPYTDPNTGQVTYPAYDQSTGLYYYPGLTNPGYTYPGQPVCFPC